MRSLPKLVRLIHSIAFTSAAATVGAAACGGGTGSLDNSPLTPSDGGTRSETSTPVGDAGVSWPGFATTVCDGSSYNPLAGVTPATPVDYMELRAQVGQSGVDSGVSNDPPRLQSATGTACATASDKTACTSTLAATTSPVGWPLQYIGGAGLIQAQYVYLVYTRGDDVGVVTSVADLATFVAPIESAKDAALFVSIAGYSIVCPSQNAKQTGSGYEIIARSGSTCGEGTHLDEHRLSVNAQGAVQVLESVLIANGVGGCAVGRRPPLLCAREEVSSAGPASDSAVAALLVEVAELEAASIGAFEIIAAELAHHRAPAELVDEAHRARADEVRHARVMKALAEAHGGDVKPPTVVIGAPRSLFELALDNAVEGCVRETFGAAIAALQAARARDPRIATTMTQIAADETRHAALSWDIDAWAKSALTADEVARIATAKRAAIADLRRSVDAEYPIAVQEALGMPDRTTALRALETLEASLWA